MSSPQQPTPSSGSAPAQPAIPLNPDGTPSLGVGVGASSVPIDGSGALDTWGLPQWILDYEKKSALPFYWDNEDVTDKPVGGVKQDFKVPVHSDAESLMKQFAAMAYNDPSKFVALQTALAQGPWVSGLKVTGAFDPDTEKALAAAMGQYLKTSEGANVPVTFKDFILQSAQTNQTLNPTNGAGGTGGTSSRPELTDPDTLVMYAQKAAQAALGRSLSSDEVNSFVNEFHSQQQSSFNNALQGNGPVVDKNDPRASAIGFVTSQHQQEFSQHQTQGYTDAFLNMFLGGTSAAPNVNVDSSAVGY